MQVSDPAENYRRIRNELPECVALVVAVKGRRTDEVRDVVQAGARLIGQNYVQEAEALYEGLGELSGRVQWHLIGHLQRNKVNSALPLFNVIQSIDSLRLARAVEKRADRPVRCLIEVNIAGEESKFGVRPDETEAFLRRLGQMRTLRVEGLMTMEPFCPEPEDARPYLRRMRELFQEMQAAEIAGVSLETLSMGMTNSWRIAVEEGSTMVRIGTAIFGPRPG